MHSAGRLGSVERVVLIGLGSVLAGLIVWALIAAPWVYRV